MPALLVHLMASQIRSPTTYVHPLCAGSASQVVAESLFGHGAISGQEEVESRGEGTWTAHDSSSLYRLQGWGAPYFVINSQGHLCVRPSGSAEGTDEVDLVAVIETLAANHIHLPLVLRFPDILHHRMLELQTCFSLAASKFNYKQQFQGVFPIKCNHERHMVEQIVECGFGLEVGSKPELLIAMAKLGSRAGRLLICNGYKDSAYVNNVLLAQRLGIHAVLVLEQMEELEEVISCSNRLGVRPILGLRAKMSTKHNGHWGNTSGDNSKFGLTVNEIVAVVHRLRQEGMLDCLQLLHFHIGSQISSILTIKEVMREGSHTYCELARMGAPMGFIDVGGGLGIDYDGTKSQSSASANYSMQNYANDVVAALMDACLLKGVAEPVIISESGRALASHSSVLVFDVLSASHYPYHSVTLNIDNLAKDAAACLTIDEECLVQVYSSMEVGNAQEAYNDAKQLREEAGSLFKLGCLSLEQRAQAEALYDCVSQQMLTFAPQLSDELRLSLAATYHVNLSVFRSAPDSWAIDQIFPIMPLHRLTEKPTTLATLADLTCDSDGKIDRFVGASGDISSVLPVHDLHEGEPYYLGLFLGGVYQEVLGSAHNLFGSTHVVHVRATGDGRFLIEHVLPGQSVGQVLCSTHH
ncbi:unnamed protein product, partial [Sphagnum compactum]